MRYGAAPVLRHRGRFSFPVHSGRMADDEPTAPAEATNQLRNLDLLLANWQLQDAEKRMGAMIESGRPDPTAFGHVLMDIMNASIVLRLPLAAQLEAQIREILVLGAQARARGLRA